MSQPQGDARLDVDAAISRAENAIDSFVLNAIQFGVFFPVSGFVGHVGAHAMDAVNELAAVMTRTPTAAREATAQRIDEIVVSLRTSCRSLVELVEQSKAFRTLPETQWRALVREIRPRRDDCATLLQELESLVGATKTFYRLRSANSAASFDWFVSDLEGRYLEQLNSPNHAAIVQPPERLPSEEIVRNV